MELKIAILFIVVGVSNVLATPTYSQIAKVSLDMKNRSLEQVMDEIESQSEFYFIFNQKQIDVNRVVDIQVENKLITDILPELFKGTNVNYAVFDRKILLTTDPLENNLLAIASGTELQQKQITGTVTDETGSPLPGVNVQVEGTTIGSITDINGKYSINKPNENVVLVFSFIGYINQKVSATGKTTIDISLVPSTKSLDEVVVVGYGTVLKKNITTSISKVSADAVPKASSSNITQLLLGRAAGLQATVASAQPGGNVNISIRGAGAPIYIVDGIVMPGISLEGGAGGTTSGFLNNVNRGALAGLNPEDIESIEILKDASVSIYGIGASQGVILVTTKRAKEGPLKVSYDGSYSVVTNYKYLDILNSQQYLGLVNAFSKEQYLYLNKLAPYGTNVYSGGWTTIYDDAAIADAKTTDWKNMVLRNGSVSNHNITMNGGGKSVTYYISGNYFKQDGTVSNSSMERFAIRSSIVMQLNSFIKLTSIINANRNNYNNSSVGSTSSWTGGAQSGGALINALTYPPNIPLFDANGKYSVFKNIPNPVSMEDMLDRTYVNGVFMSFAADFTIIKNMLTAKLLFGDNLEHSRRSTYVPIDVYFGQIYQSRGNLGEDNHENQTLEATMAFNKKFGSFLNFDAVIGVGKYYNKNNGMGVSYVDQYDAIGNDNLGSVSGIITPRSYLGLDEKRSQFARLNFDILDRYVINSTLRRDGTDKFFPDKKYVLFPSVSAAWKMSNESFMKGVAWINLLKVRASMGVTGSDNLGTLLYGTYGPTTNFVMFNQNTMKFIPVVLNGLDYPDVSWEKTTMKNIGLDFSLFRDRISGSFDLFRNDITDMLGNANTSALSMFGTYPINGGHMRREGWDASINTKNMQTSDFSWTSVLNFTRYNSLWMEMMPGYDYLSYEKRGVVPTNARYFYETSGMINADMSNMPESQLAGMQIPGYPIIADRNGDGTITIDDIKMTNEVPDIYFGFGNTFNYKNFDLDIFMYSQLGVNKYNYAWSWISPTNLANEISNANSFSYESWNSLTNPNGTRPGIAYSLASVPLPGGAGLDLGYQKASFLRVRNITFGYNFTSKILGDVSKYISNLRVYVDAQNPLIFTKFDGFDPEVDTGKSSQHGVNRAEYPQTRTFTAGVKVTF